MAPSPEILIIAGPNGAGKTTFAREFLPNEAKCLIFVNADLIASGLSPFDPSVSAVRAGRLMLQEIHRLVSRGESFSFETTLSGLNYTRHIPRWQELGYFVRLYFLSLSSVDIAITRVSERVRKGGHNIPADVIERRFKSGQKNFNSSYKGLVNEWILFENNGSVPAILERGGKHG
ncbi:Zeta toxin family protein [bacterium]|jgi:predicted ABC-type ATPase|nr:Zeta toxin family protein [bacterium]